MSDHEFLRKLSEAERVCLDALKDDPVAMGIVKRIIHDKGQKVFTESTDGSME